MGIYDDLMKELDVGDDVDFDAPIRFHGSHKELRTDAIEDRRAIDGCHPVNSQMKMNKKRVREHLGNKCSKCGNDDVDLLDVHHVEKDGKSEREGLGGLPYWRHIWKEVKSGSTRYVLLCKNCHAKWHILDNRRFHRI